MRIKKIASSAPAEITSGASNRAFGTPSIRTDIPKKDVRSVADTQNYGDEVI